MLEKLWLYCCVFISSVHRFTVMVKSTVKKAGFSWPFRLYLSPSDEEFCIKNIEKYLKSKCLKSFSSKIIVHG